MTSYQVIHWRCIKCHSSDMNPLGEAYIKKCPSCGSKELEFSTNNFEEIRSIIDPPLPELNGDIEEQIETLLAILNGPHELSNKRYFEIISLIAKMAKKK